MGSLLNYFDLRRWYITACSYDQKDNTNYWYLEDRKMPMRIDDKKVAVEELKDIANKATSAVAADYHGASVTELTKLRKDARDTSVHLKVIRNTLAKKALTDTKFSCFEDLLVGPTMLAFSLEDPTSAAKLVNDFSKVNSKFAVKGISLGDSFWNSQNFLQSQTCHLESRR